MIRTTIRMDDELAETVKVAAAKSGRTFTKFIEDAVRHQLALDAEAADDTVAGLLIVSGTGLLPGVDIDSNAALIESMEGTE